MTAKARSGDIILEDKDGVIVIPRKAAPEILVAAKSGHAKRQWVIDTLEKKQAEIVDAVYGEE